MITHLRLRNWRNFVSVDTLLQPRTFLVGPNASGKSNFLDAFRFLCDVASEGGGLQEALKDRGGLSRLRSLAARRVSDIVLDVSLIADSTPWRYRLSIGSDKGRAPIIHEESVWKGGEKIVGRPTSDDERDAERLRQTDLQQVNSNAAFRPVAQLFRSIQYRHVVPQLIREPEHWDTDAADPFGQDLIERMLSTRKSTREARLRRLQRALSVAVPQLKELKVERDAMSGVAHLQGRYEHWRPHGAWQSEADFSDGTLRLLGLLWALLDGDGPLLLEEPELSLHRQVVRVIPQLIARVQRSLPQRQIVISTHSADLLFDRGIAPEEVLLFIPSDEGTVVSPSASHKDVTTLLAQGISLADAILPKVEPQHLDQLTLF